MITCTLSLSQSLAMRIRSRQASEVPPFAKPFTGDEKTRH
jgi:hypothetical protein